MHKIAETLHTIANMLAGGGLAGTGAVVYRDQILGEGRISWMEKFAFDRIDLSNGDMVALVTAGFTVFFAAYGNWDKLTERFRKKDDD